MTQDGPDHLLHPQHPPTIHTATATDAAAAGAKLLWCAGAAHTTTTNDCAARPPHLQLPRQFQWWVLRCWTSPCGA